MNSALKLRRTPSGPSRRGFTLVELLVVFAVLALLIALLLPAINGAVKTARSAAASTEISMLAQSLAQFKSTHNVYPPSRIILSESGNYSTTYLQSNNPALGAMSPADVTILANRSVSYLRRIWPKMVLITSGTGINASQIPGQFYDFNGDGAGPTISGGVLGAGQVHLLDGAECLVFFLGGLPGKVDGQVAATTGFSQNPANPAISALNTTLGANRTSPLYEFRPGRLVDGKGANGFPEYLDGLSGSSPQPFVYFSSYEGAGYDPDDVNYADEGIGGNFYKNGVVFASPAPNPYTNGPPIPVTGSPNPECVNKNTFQILSAGLDNEFGIGGAYKANGTEVLPFVATYGSPTGLTASVRDRERDNLTNFKGGRLD